MNYTLIEDYFTTSLFQQIVQTYFDTVLAEILQKHSIIEAKGLFVKNDQVLKDDFDMPYHIHILNGLIPSLLIYEKYLIEKDWINTKKAELYIKTFILGYTFHDANKLLNINSLQDAIKELDKTIDQYTSIKMFYPDFEEYKGDVYFLCLSDEDRTSVLANQYKITLSEIHLKEVLAMLCKFADKIASNQNFDSVETFYESISKSLSIISGINSLPISYVEVNPNPYTLLSQNILQSARQVLAQSGKKVFQALRNGFVYFGEDLNETEIRQIQLKTTQVSSDIDPVGLTKIDAQKCSFGFIGSVDFSKEVIEKIIDEKKDSFFSLSPNGKDKVRDFKEFVELNAKLIETYELPIKIKIQNDKLYLNVDKESCEGSHLIFFKLYCLNKIQWLNVKQKNEWKADFEEWQNKEVKLISEIILNSDNDDDKLSITNTLALKEYIEANTNASSSLLKTYLNIVKTHSLIIEKDEDEIEDYIQALEEEIILSFTGDQKENNLVKEFFERYFNFKGNSSINIFDNYNPVIPEKGKMCAFTGGIGLKEYKEDVAFSMKARGFSNRTITSLNNNTSHISDLYSEENKLRKSYFSNSDANTIIYNDFFETTLEIDRDILAASVKAKNIKVLEDSSIQFDKNAKFQYNLYNLNFDKIATSIEGNFYFVRKNLLLVKELGIRSFITGVMSPYIPHKEAFRYENAPRFLQLLGWNKVRLINLENVLEEISLVLTLGSGRLDSNLLKISESRNSYFRLYYLLKEDDKKKVYDKLRKFINNNPKLFTGMTVTENLAELATKITMIGYSSSGSEETWLIRKALEFVRKEVKQGFSREDVIQRTCGNIYKTMRLDYVNTDAIKEFATAVYDELFINEWKGKLPNLNREKDWIYQFAFLYREKSLEKIDNSTANKIKDELTKNKIELTRENILAYFKKDKKEKYADKYINIILNNQ
jgi:CRISPR-associated protein Csc3